MTLTYEDARATCEAAPKAEFDLLAYTGSPTDSAYLKSYVLNAVTSIYGVSAEVFDSATVYSTTLLRDFVHRALYQTTDAPYIDDLQANGELVAPQTEDVATGLRYPAFGLCGLMAWQEYQVFHAFGYKTELLAFANGNIDDFTDSHTSTEVYCEDIGKSIVQDATFNFWFEDADGNPLSWLEARDAKDEGVLQFDNFDIYTYYRNALEPQIGPMGAELKATFVENYFKVPLLWAHDGEAPGTNGSLYQLFPDWQNAHDPSVFQGGTYSDAPSALAAVQAVAAEGFSWRHIADVINDDHYATGFRVGSSEWITVRLADGTYLSIETHTSATLNGSYDQLVNEATGGPTLNSGSDLSFLLQPADVLDWRGDVMRDWIDPGQTPDILTLRNTTTGALNLWSLDERPIDATSFGFPDKAYAVEDRGDYDGDGHVDILFFNHSNGQVGYWDQHQSWHRLDALSSAWREEAHTGSSDFWDDGADDILWRNTSTGQVVAWDMADGSRANYKSYGVVGLNWQVVGTADLNGDGTDDILWRDQDTGQIREWLMQDGTVVTNKGIDTVNNNWTILGLGDFSHDGSSDILWRNSATAEVGYWDMDDGKSSGFRHLDALPSNWQVLGVVDTNGDGTADVVWHNTLNNELYYWQMHNGTPTVVAQGTLSADWDVV
ncbi:MAG: FG-GAP repeat domain-containing protein [Variibacter sp.]